MFLNTLLCIFGCIILVKLFAILTKGDFQTNVSLKGKTAFITGGYGGMGYETALFLATRGCRVIIADISNAVDAARDIGKTSGNPDVVYHNVDLSQLASVRKLSAILQMTETRLDIFICNAGCGGYTCKSDDGIYKVLQVNYLGHFLLIHLLSPLLIKTKNSRIVFVSSLMAFTNNLSQTRSVNTLVNLYIPTISSSLDYGNSKACMIASSAIFAEKFRKHNVKIVSCHPGVVKTKFIQNAFHTLERRGVTQNIIQVCIEGCVNLLVSSFGKTPRDGAKCILYSSLSKDVDSGDFIIDCRKFIKPFNIYDKELCRKIWLESIELAKIQSHELLN